MTLLNNHKSNKGVALLTVVILLFAVMILILTGAQLITTSIKESRHQQDTVGEAENVARSGLVDTIAWFKRQPNQPVHSSYSAPVPHTWEDGAFNPNTSTETINQNIGLVKEYELSENGIRWARYEIKRQLDTVAPYNFPYDPEAAHDITSERFNPGTGQKGDGLAWSFVSTGYVYRRHNPAVPFNVPPNEIVSKSKISTEIIRLSLQVPTCAVFVNNGGTAPPPTSNAKVIIEKYAKVNAGSVVGCGRSLGTTPFIVDYSAISTAATGRVLGTPQYQSYPGTDYTVSFVLGVSTLQLRALADYSVNSVSDLPSPMPDMALIYINGDANFTAERPLRSSGILIVNGNLTIDINTSSLYSGVIYVSGIATINPPCYISGCVIAYRGLTLSNTAATDVAEIAYDQSIVDSVRQRICQYRENKSAIRRLDIPNF
ncbi:MAG: hypothetical protein PHE88_04965 [Elusimicrobia bacterium]|nr:hypothetical protein [Elusimicrobiota bacterium]